MADQNAHTVNSNQKMGILEMDFERIFGVPFFHSSSHSIMLCKYSVINYNCRIEVSLRACLIGINQNWFQPILHFFLPSSWKIFYIIAFMSSLFMHSSCNSMINCDRKMKRCYFYCNYKYLLHDLGMYEIKMSEAVHFTAWCYDVKSMLREQVKYQTF